MLRLACFILALTIQTLPVRAQEHSRFDVRFRGVPVASVTVVSRETASAYALAGQVRAAGIGGLFADIRFDMAVEGQMSRAGPQPLSYREDVDTGRRQSRVEMSWSGITPRITAQDPPPNPGAVPAASAAGPTDPLTALWQVLRDRPDGALCDRLLQVFDGARRSQLGLAAPHIADDTAQCAGEYRRLAGFPAAEMAERDSFPFTAHYERSGDVWRLTDVETSSLYGQVRIQRRD